MHSLKSEWGVRSDDELNTELAQRLYGVFEPDHAKYVPWKGLSSITQRYYEHKAAKLLTLFVKEDE